MTNLQKLQMMRGAEKFGNQKKLADLRESKIRNTAEDMMKECIAAKKYDRRLLESTGCLYTGAFPEWAVGFAKDYANREDLSESQAAMVKNWMYTLESQGYDLSKIKYGRDVYESENPEFGMPCECVDVEVPLRNELVNEAFMFDDVGTQAAGSDYEVTVLSDGSGTPVTRRISAQSLDDLIDQAVRLFAGLGLRYDQVEEVSCMKVQDGSDQSEIFVKPFLDMLQQMD